MGPVLLLFVCLFVFCCFIDIFKLCIEFGAKCRVLRDGSWCQGEKASGISHVKVIFNSCRAAHGSEICVSGLVLRSVLFKPKLKHSEHIRRERERGMKMNPGQYWVMSSHPFVYFSGVQMFTSEGKLKCWSIADIDIENLCILKCLMLYWAPLFDIFKCLINISAFLPKQFIILCDYCTITDLFFLNRIKGFWSENE